MSKMKVLVTGADGFIGKNLLDQLSTKYSLICIVRDRSFRRNGVKIVYGDVTDENTVRLAVKGIDAIVHLAAVLNPFDKNVGKVNVGSTRLLVSAAKDAGVKKIIFISTENVLYGFDDAYSETKRAAERIVKTFKNYLILRPTLVYGKYDERYVGRIVNIAEKYKVIPIPGDGEKLFQPVYVDDVIKSIDNGLKYDIRGEYVVAGPERMTYNDFVRKILKELDVKINIVHIPLGALKLVDYFNKNLLRIPHIRIFQIKSLEIDRVYDMKKTIKALRYKPTPFDVGVRKTIEFMKDL